MYCYKCGCELNKTDHCPNCGADVATYKKIIYTSNELYNDGLQKASVRDLSGAILSLKNSLWFNKDNLDARNLLGLVYYEIGETVAALSEWVISKNINDERLHRKNNPGADYLAQVQASKQTMDNLDASIARYNHALECCYSGNLDVAVLQLKKVLSINPKYLRARQLLALLFIESGQNKKAARELQRCLALDGSNTTTLRYLQEVNSRLAPEGSGNASASRANVRTVKTASLGDTPQTTGKKTGTRNKKPKIGSVISYTAGNETIIQPVNARNPGVDGFGLPSWIYGGVIGLLVGAALVAFLIMPTRVQSIRSDAQNQIREISSESDQKDAQLTDLQSQLDTVTEDLQALQEQQAKAEGGEDSTSKSNALMKSAALYIEDSVQVQDAADALALIDPETAAEDMSDEFVKLYNDLYPLLRAQILQTCADSGIKAYEADTPDYETAAAELEKANKFENTDNLGQTWAQRQYYLADSYYQLYLAAQDKTAAAENITKARDVIAALAAKYPDSDYTQKANALLEQLPDVQESAQTSDSAAQTDDSDNPSAQTGQAAGAAQTAETSQGTGNSRTTGTETGTGTADTADNSNG